jgi:mannitol/fructose-specific phosphotransferase system IIA component (Ntr-type)
VRLRDYLQPDLILTDLAAEDMESTIRRLAERFAEAGVVSSEEEARAGLQAREEAHTTVMGHGLAIPHAMLPGLRAPVLLLALAPEPVPFGPPGSEPVRVFFTILSPPDRQGEHIKLLARICRLTRHDDFVDDLAAVATPDEALAVIRRVDEEHV